MRFQHDFQGRKIQVQVVRTGWAWCYRYGGDEYQNRVTNVDALSIEAMRKQAITDVELSITTPHAWEAIGR